MSTRATEGEIMLRGRAILERPLLNKGTAFTDAVQQVQDAMWQPVYGPPVEANGA